MQGENLSKGSGNKISLVLFKKEPNIFRTLGTNKLPQRQINGSSTSGGAYECSACSRGGPYGTLFATFSCHHRQKCLVSCNN
jgi:hypothetical protein